MSSHRIPAADLGAAFAKLLGIPTERLTKLRIDFAVGEVPQATAEFAVYSADREEFEVITKDFEIEVRERDPVADEAAVNRRAEAAGGYLGTAEGWRELEERAGLVVRLTSPDGGYVEPAGPPPCPPGPPNENPEEWRVPWRERERKAGLYGDGVPPAAEGGQRP